MSNDTSIQEILEAHFSDMRIRQMLTPEKATTPLSRGTFYVLPYETRAEPGFLCCFPGRAAYWLAGRLDSGQPLRLRLSSALFERGSVLIATLDRQHDTLVLEDVWLFKGENLRKQPYSQRYKKLKPFWDEHFVQDVRLSGLEVSLAKPLPLDQLKEQVESHRFQGIDLIPEQGDRRRFFLPLGKLRPAGSPKRARVSAAPAVPLFEDTVETHDTQEHPTWSYAKSVPGMPDTYDLVSGAGAPLGSAAVQSFALSQELRKAFNHQKMVAVSIAWHSDFLCYEILGLYQNGQR